MASRAARSAAESARKKGRKVVLVAYFAFSVLVIAVCTVEVTLQACARVKRTDALDVDCRSGVLSLMQAVERATRQASTGTRPEREAVLAYRAALEPEWSRREAIRSACEGDPGLEETLDAVLHLGWAEERAVRRDSLETTDFRRRAHELVSRHIGRDAVPAGSASSVR